MHVTRSAYVIEAAGRFLRVADDKRDLYWTADAERAKVFPGRHEAETFAHANLGGGWEVNKLW